MILQPLLAVTVKKQPCDDEKLAHRFAGAAGFCNDIEYGLIEINDVKKSRHALGIDIILNIEFGAVPLFARKLVIVLMAERLMHRRRAERTAAYAENNEIFRTLAYPRGGLVYPLNILAFGYVKLAPTELIPL